MSFSYQIEPQFDYDYATDTYRDLDGVLVILNQSKVKNTSGEGIKKMPTFKFNPLRDKRMADLMAKKLAIAAAPRASGRRIRKTH